MEVNRSRQHAIRPTNTQHDLKPFLTEIDLYAAIPAHLLRGTAKRRGLGRVHSCACGLDMDRDENAALVILSRGVVVPEVDKIGGSARDCVIKPISTWKAQRKLTLSN